MSFIKWIGMVLLYLLLNVPFNLSAQDDTTSVYQIELSCDQKMHLVKVGVFKNVIILNSERLYYDDLLNTDDEKLFQYASRAHNKGILSVVLGVASGMFLGYGAATMTMQGLKPQPVILIPGIAGVIVTGGLRSGKKANLQQYVKRYNELKLKELNEEK